ncbi:MAG TPA: hypothetical protein VK465_01465 [Fibrobacteria bacterium]|nr:hypothetical protein [Fibrobacteria bacterium]
MAKKNGILPKNGGSVGPVALKEPDMPKSVRIEEANGGFTVHCQGGKEGYGRKPDIATDFAGIQAILERHFGKAKGKKEGDDDA